MQIYDIGIMITVIMSIKCMYSAFLDEQYLLQSRSKAGATMYIDSSQVTCTKGGQVVGACSMFITRRDTTAVITMSKEVFVKKLFYNTVPLKNNYSQK